MNMHMYRDEINHEDNPTFIETTLAKFSTTQLIGTTQIKKTTLPKISTTQPIYTTQIKKTTFPKISTTQLIDTTQIKKTTFPKIITTQITKTTSPKITTTQLIKTSVIKIDTTQIKGKTQTTETQRRYSDAYRNAYTEDIAILASWRARPLNH